MDWTHGSIVCCNCWAGLQSHPAHIAEIKLNLRNMVFHGINTCTLLHYSEYLEHLSLSAVCKQNNGIWWNFNRPGQSTHKKILELWALFPKMIIRAKKTTHYDLVYCQNYQSINKYCSIILSCTTEGVKRRSTAYELPTAKRTRKLNHQLQLEQALWKSIYIAWSISERPSCTSKSNTKLGRYITP